MSARGRRGEKMTDNGISQDYLDRYSDSDTILDRCERMSRRNVKSDLARNGYEVDAWNYLNNQLSKNDESEKTKKLRYVATTSVRYPRHAQNSETAIRPRTESTPLARSWIEEEGEDGEIVPYEAKERRENSLRRDSNGGFASHQRSRTNVSLKEKLRVTLSSESDASMSNSLNPREFYWSDGNLIAKSEKKHNWFEKLFHRRKPRSVSVEIVRENSRQKVSHSNEKVPPLSPGRDKRSNSRLISKLDPAYIPQRALSLDNLPTVSREPIAKSNLATSTKSLHENSSECDSSPPKTLYFAKYSSYSDLATSQHSIDDGTIYENKDTHFFPRFFSRWSRSHEDVNCKIFRQTKTTDV